MVEVGELKIEHVLLFVIVAFLLYHLMGRCGCSGNGFSVGGQTDIKCNKIPLYLDYMGCEKKETIDCTNYYSDGYDDGKRNCIVKNNKCITDMSRTCDSTIDSTIKCNPNIKPPQICPDGTLCPKNGKCVLPILCKPGATDVCPDGTKCPINGKCPPYTGIN
jgi:hypothetical protein